MKKIKVLLQSAMYIVLFLIINFLVLTLLTVYFNNVYKVDTSSEGYTLLLANFYTKNQLLIIILSFLLWIPLLWKNRVLKKTFNKQGFSKTLYWSLLGICINILWNIILRNMGLVRESLYSNVITVLSTCIIGPILEELVFRGIIFPKIKTVYSDVVSIILVSFLFAIYHGNLQQGIYAFIISIIITMAYNKYNNLWLPIIIHCISNLTSVLLMPVIFNANKIFILILALIVLFNIFMCISILNENRKINHNINRKISKN